MYGTSAESTCADCCVAAEMICTANDAFSTELFADATLERMIAIGLMFQFLVFKNEYKNVTFCQTEFQKPWLPKY